MTAILRVAVPVPLNRLFDYLPPDGVDSGMLRPGVRLTVPFGRRTLTGVLIDVRDAPEASELVLRPALSVLDARPLLADADLGLLRWAAAYYHHPPGEVLPLAFPPALRAGGAEELAGVEVVRLTDEGQRMQVHGTGRRAPTQKRLLDLLADSADGVALAALRALFAEPLRVVRALESRGWVETFRRPPPPHVPSSRTAVHPLNPEQVQAVASVAARFGHFAVFLLDGVTGSGKTEVYLALAERLAAQGGQTLVLLPEIALTPQTAARFNERFGGTVPVLHSGLGERERALAWQRAQRGESAVVLGTRSAVFTPLPRLGLVVVDEEHDASYKAQEGLRFSARDAAIVRGRETGVPVLLGSATPSLESLANAARDRFTRLTLTARATGATEPSITLLDIRNCALDNGLSPALLRAIDGALQRGEQSLIFLNRRGFSPLLTCHACGWVAECQRCAAPLVVHQGAGRLRCHHCAHERAMPADCPVCGESGLRRIGLGTERVEQALSRLFPERRIVRIDRDTTRTGARLDHVLEQIHAGEAEILVGTQMLSKGHHFPSVTLTGIVDVDAGLYSVDFRASERLAQLVVQVAGRAGRGDRPGEVLLQTRHPEHPLLLSLRVGGYPAFARLALEERQAAGLPPFAHLALIRAESAEGAAVTDFLGEIAQGLGRLVEGVRVLGPAPAPRPLLAGRHRGQILLQSVQRQPLHQALGRVQELAEDSPNRRRVRWTLDVDPSGMD